MRAIRLGTTLHEIISGHTGLLCTVEWVNPHGFFGTGTNGRPVYFTDHGVLHVPFGIVLDRPMAAWIERVCLQKGDRFFKRDSRIYRWPRADSVIQYSPEDMVDLNRPLYKSPPAPSTIVGWMQQLIEAVADQGRFEGMGGTLVAIRDRSPGLVPGNGVSMSLTSRVALSHISSVLKSATCEDVDGFLRAWDPLIGLGPGLTPSADDVFMGFLASQRMLSTPLWERIRSSGQIPSLKKTLRQRTTPISAGILCDALDGRFSEILYCVFEDLSERGPVGADRSAIRDSLKWGHSSGTDAVVGAVLGLCTLC